MAATRAALSIISEERTAIFAEPAADSSAAFEISPTETTTLCIDG